MKQSELSRAQTWAILGGAAVMLSLAMGMRQSWGLFQPHMMRDIGLTAADFSLAIAIQNIVWGITQPFVGILADRHGVRPVAVFGVAIYGGRHPDQPRCRIPRWSSRWARDSASALRCRARLPTSR